jgi:hypothetical protein
LLDQDTTKNNSDTQLLILVTPRMVRYAPRTDHVIYAGQGEPEGQGGAESTPNVVAPPTPPVPAPPPPENAPPQQQPPPPQAPPQQPPEQPAPAPQNPPAPLQAPPQQ